VTASRSRISGLDGLRGIAAVAVMIFHFDFVFLPSSRLWKVFPPLSQAYLSVDLFLIMSGYVMAHVYGEQLSSNLRETWKPFVLARVGRIYPLFILTLSVLVAVYATGHLASHYVSFSVGAVALQPFMLQAAYHGMNWNYPAWSIGTEAAAYAVFIFAAKPLLFGKRPIVIAGALLAVIAALCILKNGRLEFATQAPAYIRTFAGFGIGVLIFRAMRDYRNAPFLFATFSILPLTAMAYLTQIDFFAFCALAMLVVLAVSCSLPFLDWKPFRVLGNWSLGIYLWHAPVSLGISAVAVANGYRLQSLSEWQARGMLFVVSLLVVVIAGLAYHFFEIPARKSIRMNIQRPIALEGAST
jgi:peptidoglycan/LPS O-acetylase OafA/YrhL